MMSKCACVVIPAHHEASRAAEGVYGIDGVKQSNALPYICRSSTSVGIHGSLSVVCYVHYNIVCTNPSFTSMREN